MGLGNRFDAEDKSMTGDALKYDPDFNGSQSRPWLSASPCKRIHRPLRRSFRVSFFVLEGLGSVWKVELGDIPTYD